ncbi:pyridoxamine 5'-phosphate oxidase family protein [Aestuariibius sp. HNIBRBA575]|uniref:pyridoxamine 5'-phosphate oxidase family protein n=1 Tax=Aestuariibius sp. HNIBRBA575 TaxID=3233343 RepID=UPI0034A53CA0
MNDPVSTPSFHLGEQQAQARAGRLEAMKPIGKIAIRPFMPDQHRAFFEQLPFVVMGSVDDHGWPWASILTGGKGFIDSPTNKRLSITAQPLPDDPLAASLTAGAPVGLLGIELATRRRNRMNAQITSQTADNVQLDVVQSFGNCPQYIQTRALRFVRAPAAQIERQATDKFRELDAAARDFIANSNTFFVSSYVQPDRNPVAEGVDVSHRGGRSGFVKVDGNTLTIPDYSGNNFFNTIGNFLVNPKAGLMFPDFETGDVLMLTGRVEMLWDDHPEVQAFHGAERGWRFHLDHGLRIYDALPFRAQFGDYSPNALMADNWDMSQARQQAEQHRNTWRPLRVAAIKDESDVIRSFTLEPVDDTPLLPFEPGQFLTMRADLGAGKPVTRTYSMSSAPGDLRYRISVKREPNGAMSNYLHDAVRVGDVIETKAPKGAFYMDALDQRPVVLIAGGVGITPMMSMTRHVLNEGIRKRHLRPTTILHAAQTTKDRAFFDDFRAAEAQSNGKLRYFSIIEKPSQDEQQGVDFHASGFIDAPLIQAALPYDDYDFYLCGPPRFMQAIYDALRALGAQDARIFAEAFGPASLVRHPDDTANPPAILAQAELSTIKFERSGFEHHWVKGDATILETAEAHGLAPAFSCRSGSCGSCATKKLSGEVAYRIPVTADHAPDEVLICCAVPAENTQELILDL